MEQFAVASPMGPFSFLLSKNNMTQSKTEEI